MNVGLIEGIEIELNQMAAEMGGLADWAGSWESTLRPGYVPAFILPFIQFLIIAFSLSFLWFEMPLFAINIPVLWLLLGSRGEANIFLSNLRKTFFHKMQNNSLSKMIVYSLGLFGLFWTFSDFFDI